MFYLMISFFFINLTTFNREKYNYMKNNFDYHDSPLENLILDFNNQSLVLYLSKYDDVFKRYDIHKVTFKKVVQFSFAMPPFKELSSMSVYDLDLKTHNGIHTAKIVVISFEGPSFEITFQCETFEINILGQEGNCIDSIIF